MADSKSALLVFGLEVLIDTLMISVFLTFSAVVLPDRVL